MIDIFVISKITQYRYYVIAITDVRSLGLSTKWRTLMIKKNYESTGKIHLENWKILLKMERLRNMYFMLK